MLKKEEMSMSGNKIIFCCCIFLFNTSICISQRVADIRDSLIYNYLGFNLLNGNEIHTPDILGKNLLNILSNERFSFQFLVEIEPKDEYNFDQFKLYSFKNLGNYSYCQKPCNFDDDSIFEKYMIGSGKFFNSHFASKSGLIAYDTLIQKIYFISGFDIQLDLEFYKEFDDQERKIKLFSFAYESDYKKGRFCKCYYLGDTKIFFRKGVPIIL